MSSIFVTNRNLSALCLRVGRIDYRSAAIEGSVAQVLRLWRRVIGHLIAPGGTDSRDAVNDRSALQTIRAAIGELQPLDRAALVQQIRLGRSIAEIAVQLKLPETEVRTVLARARRQLHMLCGEDVSGDPTS